MTYNFRKVNGWFNNHSHKCFTGNQLSETAPFIGSPQTITYQLSNRHSTQYINHRCKKNLFYYFHLCLLNSILCFCIKPSLSNLSSFHFQQRIAIRMRLRAHGHQMMVTETSKTTNFWACFFYNMFLYWIVMGSCIPQNTE